MLHVCSVHDIPPGGVLRVEASPPVAIFEVDGELLAVDDTCPHQEASLSEGWVTGGAVECPLHGICFDLRTGESSRPRLRRTLRTYPVHVRAGAVYLDVGAMEQAA